MKRIRTSLVLALVLTASSGWTQKPTPNAAGVFSPLVEGAVNPPATFTAMPSPAPASSIQEQVNVLFFEDFASGFSGNNGFGSWTAEDSGGGAIWQHVDANGDGHYADGTPSGVMPPAGEFSQNAATLNSATASNGWIIFDCDFYNTPISNGVSDVEGWLIGPSLDFGNVGSVMVEWSQYYRYCCYPEPPMNLMVSSDGGQSWTAFGAHGGTSIPATNLQSPNPLVTAVDISCVAAYASNVQIAFAYLQPPSIGSGYSHYFWGIDDVFIYENTTANDLVAVQITNGDVSSGFEYTTTPMEQAVPSEAGGVRAGLMFRSEGFTDQPNVQVTVDVLDTSGALLSSSFTSMGTVFSSANSSSCPNDDRDTVYVYTGWEPTEPGTYELRATITADVLDATPENNTISKTIVFTESEMGHGEEAWDTELVPPASEFDANLQGPCGYGHYFQMHNPGSMAYGLAVQFGPQSGGGPVEFEARIYETDGAYPLVESPYISSARTLDSAWVPADFGSGAWTYLAFDTPLELYSGLSYFAAVVAEFDQSGSLTVLADANSDTDGSSARFLRSGAGDYQWFGAQSATPAIRLVMAPIPVTGCQDPLACNYDPAASVGDSTLCLHPGCLDESAMNFDPDAACAGACVYLEFDCSSIGELAWSDEAMGLYPAWQEAMHGVAWNGEWVFNVPASVVEPSSAVTYAVHHVDWSDVSGLPNWAESTHLLGNLNAASQHCISASGTPDAPGMHQITATAEVFISIFGQPFSIGEQDFVAVLEVQENPNPIPGCTYSNAANYVPYATEDNGSCLFLGCTDESAGNFSPLALVDDGSCVPPCDPVGSSTCASDGNNDGAVTVSDLLILLGEFGADCSGSTGG